MLYPRSNHYRQLSDLSGFWDFSFDPHDVGHADGWQRGFQGRPIAVPASWNDQFDDGRDYLGAAWYQTHFDLPWGWDVNRQRIAIRFNSVNYLAEVWLNGECLGSHEGGHLPFEFDATPYLRSGDNLLVARVEGDLALDRVPPGISTNNMEQPFPIKWERFPSTLFDFFPFCGIHRPVLIYSAPPNGIADLTITTAVEGTEGHVRVEIRRAVQEVTTARVTLKGHGVELAAETRVGEAAEVPLVVPDAKLWAPGAPNLYTCRVELVSAGQVFDHYSLPVGIRTISVEGNSLLLNGKPVYLKGFDRHEDFPITGRGLVPAVVIKDYALLEWSGANAFRTSHYPYSEQTMDLADRLGYLVVDETPAVGLFFGEAGLERRLQLCRQYTRELIARDRNHPSVIMWSLANEPHSDHPAARGFFRDLYDLAKALDPTRPVTLISSQGTAEESFEFCDLVCLNRYYGWYHETGQLDAGCARLSQELDAMHAKFGKPVIMSEFGADTIPGCHALPPEIFSEEFQAEFLTRYLQVLRAKPFVIGELVWNMCDFKTGQDVRRMGGMNYKGVFTRDRRPKLAAHRLRELWREEKE